MDASLPKVTIPQLSPKEKQGLQDYWTVYEAYWKEVTAQLEEMALKHQEFKFIMQNPAARPTEEQRARNLEFQQNAILHQDWEPYLTNLQQQGMNYARGGLSFRAWFELISVFRRGMMPYLVNTYGDSAELLLSAMHGMDTLIDIALRGIGEAYLETKQQLIREQEAAVQDAIKQVRSEQRFRGLLEAAPDSRLRDR